MLDMKALMGSGGDDEGGEALGEEAVHLRRMFAAHKSGDMKTAAKAFKRAVQACVEGGYDEEESGSESEEDDEAGY